MAATDNTNSKNLEPYSKMGEHSDAYRMLSTAASLEIGKRRNALSKWVDALRDRPRFTHADKDMGEIGMLRDVWDPKIQLC
jgi:hypothetical protein